MAELRTLEEKRLSDLSGKVFLTPPPPIIELEIYGDKWIPNNHPSIGYVQFYSKGANTAYIDYGDGSPVDTVTITSAGWIIWDRLNNVHIYPRKDYWQVKIWFLRPELISQFFARYVELVGKFPSQLALYPIRDIWMIDNIKFDEFPDDIAPGHFDSLEFAGVVKSVQNSIPNWIYLSRIKFLRLDFDFNLSDLSTSNFEKLIYCVDLTTLMITCQLNNNSFPDNFKDFPTLTTLHLSYAPVTELPKNVCKSPKLLNLYIGYGNGSPYANNTISSWGDGVGLMTNLTLFSAIACDNLPTTFLTGAENTRLKKYYTGASYYTDERVNAAILSAYNRVTSLANKEDGDTALRNVTWINGGTVGVSKNGTVHGIYQAPAGYIQGISDGSPNTPMEMVYVLTKQYRWTITVNTSPTTAVTYDYLS